MITDVGDDILSVASISDIGLIDRAKCVDRAKYVDRVKYVGPKWFGRDRSCQMC